MTAPAPRWRWSARRPAIVLTALTIAAAFAVPLLTSDPAAASAPLRNHAATRGKFIGFAAAAGLLCNNSATCTSGSDPTYRSIAGTEFNQITAENAMKWDATEPNQGQFNFTAADGIVAFAQANNQQVHGHTLVWHSQTPGWVQGLSATAMRSAMQNHITQVVGRYASNPAVVSWDVANEVIDDNGQMRQSFWFNTLGQSYIADAFRFARAADPNARLCINDYNIDGMGTKSNAYFTLVQSLLSQGVPIDCIGFQGHLAVQFGFPSQVQQNLQRFANLGLEVRITELDVRIPLPSDANEITTQNTYYTNMVNACLAVTACTGVTVWGIDDGHSWVPETFPGQGEALLWTSGYQQKPAYTAVHNALAASTGDTTPPSTPGTPVASNVTSSGATLNWTASTDTGGSGLAGYNVYREQGATDPILATPTGNSATLTGLTANTQYQVYVRARDGAGNLSNPSATVTFTTTGGGTGGCTVAYTITNQWGAGFQGEIRVTNNGSTALSPWTLAFAFTNGQAITQMWGGVPSPASGNVSVTPPADWNRSIGANGGSITIGFLANWSGTNSEPSAFTLSGTACTVV
jgi:endo-1,4-beta-xylanase